LLHGFVLCAMLIAAAITSRLTPHTGQNVIPRAATSLWAVVAPDGFVLYEAPCTP
jgi:hypothetical protein